ncbi:MAG TPA: DUF2510 domain-containing protein [Mycobacteriales bacterium]|nr:DUF2510 domain-containing protein [Mycobacteriales bacterium]
MTSPAPGWYPDPGGAAPYRWWNGQTWTTATSAGTAPAAQQPVQTAPEPSAVPGHAATTGYVAAGQTIQSGVPQQAQATAPQIEPPTVPYQQSYGATSSFSHAMSAQPANTMFEQNKYAMGTFIASALSIVFALGTGFVPLIFTPFFLAFGSKGRGEKLAPLAFGAAVICGVIGFITLRNRF